MLQKPIRCVDELRHHILEDQDHARLQLEPSDSASESSSESETEIPINVDYLPQPYAHTSHEHFPHSRPSSTNYVVGNPAYDTFESCLHIANQMESVLAFYYTDEKNPNVVKVTEIFAIDDPRGPKVPCDLSWDGFETPHKVDIEVSDLDLDDSEMFKVRDDAEPSSDQNVHHSTPQH